MQPDQPSQKRRAVRWTVALFILTGWTLSATVPPSEAGRGPEDLYQTGKTCQDRLNRSPKLWQARHNWEACIRTLNTILTRYPKNRLLPKALFSLGELYAGLYRYSGDHRDAEKSQDYYRELISTDPDGPSAKTAQKRLERLGIPDRRPPLATVQNVRHWAYPDYTRLVLDLDHDTEYRPDLSDRTLVRITLRRARLDPTSQKTAATFADGLLRSVALEQPDSDTVLLTVALKHRSKQPRIALLSNPDRLVIDLFGRGSTETINPPRMSDGPSGSGSALAQSTPFDVRTIVIDPGHGGKDPGAIGRTGLTEKDVVLDIGFRLRSLIRDRMEKNVMMTREDDTFVALDDRTLLANSKNADLFISIHVNSHPQGRTRGVEIYHLGQASDHRAMAVAARENNVSMQSLGTLEQSVKQILFDLDREYTMNQSQELAHLTRQSFQTTLANRYDYNVVDHGVKRAPFYVLLNSNMPSILAEVSFISNPDEEKLLRQGPYRQAIAESLFQGIRAYLASLKPVS
ncbi:MAG: N-acetylmuramoyl-L-alanine amidase [Nitrospirae bacterium]|nr:N-acetylmuramoyl-L-alanine amidase [Nitrospirota bacterium]